VEPVEGWYTPGAQYTQLADPVDGWYDPTPQLEHEGVPGAAVNIPTGQFTQLVAPVESW